MSAIGSGVTLIAGSQLDNLTPISVASGDTITFSHFVGKKAWQIVVTDDNGNIRSDMPATQTLNARPAADTIEIVAGDTADIFISIRWQENSVEASMIPVGSSSVVITPGGD
jgi:hypothetical protein